MAAPEVNVAQLVRICDPEVFHFAETDKPCAYWSSGAHILVDGTCRCGKTYILIEKE